MTVIVAGRILTQPNALSVHARLTLATIDRGMEWLSWAMSSTSQAFEQPDETSLLIDIQRRLRGSDWVHLPRAGLKLGVTCLMASSPEELRALARVEGGDDSADARLVLSSLLKKRQLIALDDLARVPIFLTSLGVAADPLFIGLATEDLLALHSLQQSPTLANPPAGRLAEAADFSRRQARTPLEFADYMQCYLALTARIGREDADPKQRQEQVAAAISAVGFYLLHALDGPTVTELASPMAIEHIIRNWLNQGRMLGFSSLSQGLREIICNADYRGEHGESCGRIVNQYITTSGNVVRSTRSTQFRLEQDGRSLRLYWQSAEHLVELRQNSRGDLRLERLGRAA